jgi:CRISPR-associated protein Cas2
MKTLVVYDISDDSTRLKVSEKCKDFGLSRIQKSAFLGYLDSSQRKELASSLSRILGDGEGNIQLFVICNPDLTLRISIGKPFKESPDEGVLIV